MNELSTLSTPSCSHLSKQRVKRTIEGLLQCTEKNANLMFLMSRAEEIYDEKFGQNKGHYGKINRGIVCGIEALAKELKERLELE